LAYPENCRESVLLFATFSGLGDKMKKAQVQTKFVALIIALVVLLVVIFFFGNDIWFKIVNIIPGFNFTQGGTEKIEIVRYDIAENKVQYYDGVIFLDFPPDTAAEIKIGTKKVSHNNARYYFAENYYYKEDAREWLTIIDFGTVIRNSLRDRLYPGEPEIANTIPALDGCIIAGPFIASIRENSPQRANVQINLIPENSKCIDQFGTVNVQGGVVRARLDGLVEFRKISSVENDLYRLSDNYKELQDDEIQQIMRAEASKWRDSVLETPMQFKFNENEDCILVEVEKTVSGGNVYLTTDLTKPISDNNCQIEQIITQEEIEEPENPEEPLPIPQHFEYFKGVQDLIDDPEAFKTDMDVISIFVNNQETGASEDIKVYLTPAPSYPYSLEELKSYDGAREVFVILDQQRDVKVGIIQDGVITITSVQGVNSETQEYLTKLNSHSYVDLIKGGTIEA
jgi:hypothetical protein